MVIVLIQTRLRADCDLAAYQALNARMFELAQSMPGFVSVGGSDDIGIVRFTSLEALRAWRDHPEHVVSQERGRREFYASYTIEICELVRGYEFDARDQH